MALDFDGVDQYVDCGMGLDQTTNDFSIIARVNTNPLFADFNYTFSNREVGAPFTGILFVLDVADKIYFQLNDQANGHTFDVGVIVAADDTDHMIALVVDRGNDLAHTYVDNAIDVANIDISAVVGSLTSGNEARIAMDEAGNAEGDIIVSEFRLYNRVVSFVEIQTIYYAKGADNIVNGLIARYLMNEKPDGQVAAGAGVVIDVSGNGNHGTPFNNPVYRAALTRLVKTLR